MKSAAENFWLIGKTEEREKKSAEELEVLPDWNDDVDDDKDEAGEA